MGFLEGRKGRGWDLVTRESRRLWLKGLLMLCMYVLSSNVHLVAMGDGQVAGLPSVAKVFKDGGFPGDVEIFRVLMSDGTSRL